MTTVINTPSNTDSDGGAGWTVAVLILLAVIGAGVYFWFNYRGTVPAASSGTNINVTLPQNPVTNSTSTPAS